MCPFLAEGGPDDQRRTHHDITTADRAGHLEGNRMNRSDFELETLTSFVLTLLGPIDDCWSGGRSQSDINLRRGGRDGQRTVQSLHLGLDDSGRRGSFNWIGGWCRCGSYRSCFGLGLSIVRRPPSTIGRVVGGCLGGRCHDEIGGRRDRLPRQVLPEGRKKYKMLTKGRSAQQRVVEGPLKVLEMVKGSETARWKVGWQVKDGASRRDGNPRSLGRCEAD